MAHKQREVLRVALAAVAEVGGTVTEVGTTGSQHQRVRFLTANGRPVIVIMPMTPGGGRWAQNTRATVKRAARDAAAQR